VLLVSFASGKDFDEVSPVWSGKEIRRPRLESHRDVAPSSARFI
jgi:hypothetical protein